MKPIAYNSLAVRSLGFASKTLVDEVYAINRRDDFDDHLHRAGFDWRRFVPGLARVARFARFLRSCDVLITNFDGGLLRGSPMRCLEVRLLRLAGKKLIVWPYGGDSFVYSRIGDHDLRYGLYGSYPDGARRERAIERQIAHFCAAADVVIGNIPHHEALPRWDVLTVACYGVSTSEWQPDPGFRHLADGRSAPVRILHCPNHRDVKGTDLIVAAVERLKSVGLKVELEIVEGVQQSVVLAKMRDCDIVVAQLLYGYASTEIEAMSLGKPVISNLESTLYYPVARRHTYLSCCPIVSTNPEGLEAALATLVADPARREELGQAGRRYVLAFHSEAGQGSFWAAVVTHAHGGSRSDLVAWWKSRVPVDETR